MSWEREMVEITELNHISQCERHWQVYVCCFDPCQADYPFCPEHGGEPWYRCEVEEI